MGGEEEPYIFSVQKENTGESSVLFSDNRMLVTMVSQAFTEHRIGLDVLFIKINSILMPLFQVLKVFGGYELSVIDDGVPLVEDNVLYHHSLCFAGTFHLEVLAASHAKEKSSDD